MGDVPARKDFADRDFADRYTILDPLGKGGMAVVWRARDEILGRDVALKQSTDLKERFAREVLLTARLDHPNIVTVLDAGLLEGRLTFAMPIVQGVTLKAMIKARFAEREVYGRPVTLRRVVDALKVAADAVGFAHSRGVVHRDLKPDNVMIGPRGQVVVLDWGIAKVLGEEDEPVPVPSGLTDIVRAQDETDGVLGTPGFIAPEYFEDGDHDPRSDVFALGVVLYQLLCARGPFKGKSSYELLMALRRRRRRAIRGPLHVPRGLAAVCRKALEWDPAGRYADAGAMARELESWLEGSRQREVAWHRADELVEQAEALVEQMRHAWERSDALRGDAAERGAETASHAPLCDKEALWALEDLADATDLAGDLAEQHAVDLLLAARSHIPEHKGARRLLLRTLRDSHRRREDAGHVREAARAAHSLRFHGGDRGVEWLEAEALVTVRVPGELALARLELQNRRLQPGRFEALDGPPENRSLRHGSYVLRAALSQGVFLVPIRVGRDEPWPPREGGEDVWVPAGGELGVGEVFVPAGWYADRRGGWEWCNAFAIQRDPVTWEDFGAFLAEHAEHAPDEEPGHPRAPVTDVPLAVAEAYARWLARKRRLPWRLPTEREWEKAAGGVDGRRYVWGPHADPSWGRFLGSVRGVGAPVSVDADTLDVSVYGVRGMAGNVRDWVASKGRDDVARGGCWLEGAALSDVARRFAMRPGTRSEAVGFRLARSLKPE